MRCDLDGTITIRRPGGGSLRMPTPTIYPDPGVYVAIVHRGEIVLPVPGGGTEVLTDPGDGYSLHRAEHPGAVTVDDLMRAIECGELPLDSDPARRVIALSDEMAKVEHCRDIPDCLRRAAEAVRAFGAWRAARDGARLDAPDPMHWADEEIDLPPGAVS